MQLSGKRIFNDEQQKIWRLLMNPETLVRIIPGMIKLEKTAENIYRSLLAIKLGPVNSTFEGSIQLDEIAEYSHFTMIVRQNSNIGNGNAIVRLNLVPLNESQTELQFDGDVKLTGLLASMGQRALVGVTNTLSKDFFSNMERELQLQSAS
jgi:carbon monoxide dehydrogenase subunit G